MSADPWCDHAVALSPDGSAVFVTRQCNTGEVRTEDHGVYRIDTATRQPAMIAQEPQSGALTWAPKAVAVFDDLIALAVDSDTGDRAELRDHAGTLTQTSATLDVSLFDPVFLADGALYMAHNGGVVYFAPDLTMVERSVRHLRDDTRAIDLIGDQLAVGSFRGKRVFLFDATDRTELEKQSDVVRGANDVALVPTDPVQVAVVNADDQLVEIYDAAFQRVSMMSTGPEPRRVAISADAARLAVIEGGDTSPDSEQRGAVRVFELATQTQLAVVEMTGQPSSVVLSADGATVWVGRRFQGKTELNIPAKAGVVVVDVATQASTELTL